LIRLHNYKPALRVVVFIEKAFDEGAIFEYSANDFVAR
jgi:hypothetical protein